MQPFSRRVSESSPARAVGVFQRWGTGGLWWVSASLQERQAALSRALQSHTVGARGHLVSNFNVCVENLENWK